MIASKGGWHQTPPITIGTINQNPSPEMCVLLRTEHLKGKTVYKPLNCVNFIFLMGLKASMGSLRSLPLMTGC